MTKDIEPRRVDDRRETGRVTEDQRARKNLGGPRGAPELGQAPLTKNEREQMPKDVDPGHTA